MQGTISVSCPALGAAGTLYEVSCSKEPLVSIFRGHLAALNDCDACLAVSRNIISHFVCFHGLESALLVKTQCDASHDQFAAWLYL